MTFRFIVALTLVACTTSSKRPSDAPFEWRAALTELDHAVLSVCAGADRLLAVGGSSQNGLVVEWDGSAWNAVHVAGTRELLWWCWVDDAGAAIAVGERGLVLRSPARGVWTADPAGSLDDTATLYGVWGSAPDDVYVVGGNLPPSDEPSFAARFDGTSWTRVDLPPTDAVLFKVWGTSSRDVWIVGADGTAVHFDGEAWTAHATPTAEPLIAVWGTGPHDVYAVGGVSASGVILRYDGRAWTEHHRTPARLSGVWTAPDSPLFVAGDGGYLARIDRADPTRTAVAVPDATIDFHSLASYGDVLLAGGADLKSVGPASLRGSVFTHGGSFDGALVLPDAADAGGDAMVGAADAGSVDAAPVDAYPWPAPGDACDGEPPDDCGPGLKCWGLAGDGIFICTSHCFDATECGEYGEDACCAIPGPQTLDYLCIPRGYTECPE